MLSVCIPVFNKNITRLLISLVNQAKTSEHPVEFLVLDDGSNVPIIDPFDGIEAIRVLVHPSNLGRSAARNTLLQEATGPYMLLLDAGSEIIASNFLADWIRFLLQHPGQVYYGGSIYDQKPSDSEFYLRWKVGTVRESVPFEIRKSRKTSFKTNNAVVHKSVLPLVQFDERLVNYGHEDTLYGFEVSQRNIEILQVNNPVKNIGLDTNVAFLNKTAQAMENLVLASTMASSKRAFIESVRVYKVYYRLKSLRLLWLLTIMDATLGKGFNWLLARGSRFFTIYLFDGVKLLALHRILKAKRP